MDEAKPIDQSVLHLDSLTAAAAGMSRRKQSNPRQIKRKFLSFTRRCAAFSACSEFAGYWSDSDPVEAELSALVRCLSRSSGLPPRAPVFWRWFTVQTPVLLQNFPLCVQVPERTKKDSVFIPVCCSVSRCLNPPKVFWSPISNWIFKLHYL